jgi:aspartate/glutamate racemase
MKTIGLISGMGWGSSTECYRIMNETSIVKLRGFVRRDTLLPRMNVVVNRVRNGARTIRKSML